MGDLAIVFQIGSLGDSIVSVPTLLSLRELLPSVSEYLLITNNDSSLKIAANEVFDMAWKANGQITFTRAGNIFKQITSAAGTLAQLRYYRPQYGVYLAPADRSQRHVRRDELFFRAGGVKELMGFRAFTNDELAAGRTPVIQNTEAYLRFRRVWNRPAEEEFLNYSATPVLEVDVLAQETVCRWLKKERRYPDRRLVALCPYANWASRHIPTSTVVDLLSRLEKALHVEVVILGGRKDFESAHQASREADAGLNACGLFSVGESAALLQSSDLAICTESGPMHLAGALSVPSVVIFSRTNKQLGRWFPLGSGHTILYREVLCAGCDSVECIAPGHPCMREITVDQILAVASSKLSGFSLAPESLNETRAFVSPKPLKDRWPEPCVRTLTSQAHN